MFELLKYGIALILVYVGLELCLSYWINIPNTISCIVICGIVVGSIGGSVVLKSSKSAVDGIEMTDEVKNLHPE
jgi:tellurite resistance protein TerC